MRASAMSGLLNLVPRYLPRYGMAPEWTRSARPLVLLFTAVAFAITFIFKANVEAQSGAYAIGVLVLMTSAAVAVTLSARRKKQPYALLFYTAVTGVFVYTTIANTIERPEGLRTASLFIFGLVALSFLSRALRSYELRIESVRFDQAALNIIGGCSSSPCTSSPTAPITSQPPTILKNAPAKTGHTASPVKKTWSF